MSYDPSFSQNPKMTLWNHLAVGSNIYSATVEEQRFPDCFRIEVLSFNNKNFNITQNSNTSVTLTAEFSISLYFSTINGGFCEILKHGLWFWFGVPKEENGNTYYYPATYRPTKAEYNPKVTRWGAVTWPNKNTVFRGIKDFDIVLHDTIEIGGVNPHTINEIKNAVICFAYDKFHGTDDFECITEDNDDKITFNPMDNFSSLEESVFMTSVYEALKKITIDNIYIGGNLITNSKLIIPPSQITDTNTWIKATSTPSYTQNDIFSKTTFTDNEDLITQDITKTGSIDNIPLYLDKNNNRGRVIKNVSLGVTGSSTISVIKKDISGLVRINSVPVINSVFGKRDSSGIKFTINFIDNDYTWFNIKNTSVNGTAHKIKIWYAVNTSATWTILYEQEKLETSADKEITRSISNSGIPIGSIVRFKISDGLEEGNTVTWTDTTQLPLSFSSLMIRNTTITNSTKKLIIPALNKEWDDDTSTVSDKTAFIGVIANGLKKDSNVYLRGIVGNNYIQSSEIKTASSTDTINLGNWPLLLYDKDYPNSNKQIKLYDCCGTYLRPLQDGDKITSFYLAGTSCDNEVVKSEVVPVEIVMNQDRWITSLSATQRIGTHTYDIAINANIPDYMYNGWVDTTQGITDDGEVKIRKHTHNVSILLEYSIDNRDTWETVTSWTNIQGGPNISKTTVFEDASESPSIIFRVSIGDGLSGHPKRYVYSEVIAIPEVWVYDNGWQSLENIWVFDNGWKKASKVFIFDGNNWAQV